MGRNRNTLIIIGTLKNLSDLGRESDKKLVQTM